MVPSGVELKVEVEGKDSRLLRGYYDSLTGRIDSQLEKLEEEGTDFFGGTRFERDRRPVGPKKSSTARLIPSVPVKGS